MKEKTIYKTAFRLLMLVAMLFVTSVSSGQPSLDRQRYRIDYVDESHLFRKDNTITVVNVNFEWPVRLSGLPTTALQESLCNLFFDKKAEALEVGLPSFFSDFGKEIRQMPDEQGLKKKYVRLVLQTLAWEKDKYISLRTARIYRDGANDYPDSVVNELLTYDIVSDKVLRIEDLFRWKTIRNMDLTFSLSKTILDYLPKGTYNVVDVLSLPDEACFLPMGVLFNIPETVDEDGLNAFSIVPYNVLLPYIKPAAKKTLTGEGKKRKDMPDTTWPFINDSLSVDTTMVYDLASTMPEYNGNKRDMMAFIYRQLNYPSYERLLGIQGKAVVSFVVERDGTLSSPSVISPVSPGIDREAVKAVMSMPKWKPGMKEGVPVRVRTTLPVTFKLMDGENNGENKGGTARTN